MSIEIKNNGKGGIIKTAVGTAVNRIAELLKRRSMGLGRKLFDGRHPIFIKVKCGNRIVDFGKMNEEYSFKVNAGAVSLARFAANIASALSFMMRGVVVKTIDEVQADLAIEALAKTTASRAKREALAEINAETNLARIADLAKIAELETSSN